MTPTARKVFYSTIVLVALVWIGVGYLFVHQRYPNLLASTQASLASLPLVSHLIPATTPTPPAVAALPTLSGALSTFTDPEYNFSFAYPVELTVQEVKNPREKLLGFAQENYHPDPEAQLNITPRPSPSLERTLPVIKQYSITDPSEPEQNLIDVSVVEGNYETQAQYALEIGQAFQGKTDTSTITPPTSWQLSLVDGPKATVLQLPVGSGEQTYSVAYYPLDEKHYLMVEIQPEAGLNSTQLFDDILLSVKSR